MNPIAAAKRISGYAAKFLAETPEGEPHPGPTDDEMAARFAWCCRVPTADEYPAIRTAILAQGVEIDDRRIEQMVTLGTAYPDIDAAYSDALAEDARRHVAAVRAEMVDCMAAGPSDLSTFEPADITAAIRDGFIARMGLVGMDPTYRLVEADTARGSARLDIDAMRTSLTVTDSDGHVSRRLNVILPEETGRWASAGWKRWADVAEGLLLRYCGMTVVGDWARVRYGSYTGVWTADVEAHPLRCEVCIDGCEHAPGILDEPGCGHHGCWGVVPDDVARCGFAALISGTPISGPQGVYA